MTERIQPEDQDSATEEFDATGTARYAAVREDWPSTRIQLGGPKPRSVWPITWESRHPARARRGS